MNTEPKSTIRARKTAARNTQKRAGYQQASHLANRLAAASRRAATPRPIADAQAILNRLTNHERTKALARMKGLPSTPENFNRLHAFAKSIGKA